MQGVLASLLAKKLAVAVRPGLAWPQRSSMSHLLYLRCNLRNKIATDFNSIFAFYIRDLGIILFGISSGKFIEYRKNTKSPYERAKRPLMVSYDSTMHGY